MSGRPDISRVLRKLDATCGARCVRKKKGKRLFKFVLSLYVTS